MPAVIKLGWQRFTLISQIVGDVQGRVIITFFYFTILIPFGLISRLTTDPLHRKSGPSWLEREPVKHDLNSARGQG